MQPYKRLFNESNNDYNTSLSKTIFDKLNKPKFTLTDLYKIKSIRDLRNYFKDYHEVRARIEIEHLKSNSLKQLLDDYDNNKYDKAIRELQRYIGINTENIAMHDKMFKTKTTVKDIIDKVIEANNSLKNTGYAKADFEKDIGY